MKNTGKQRKYTRGEERRGVLLTQTAREYHDSKQTLVSVPSLNSSSTSLPLCLHESDTEGIYLVITVCVLRIAGVSAGLFQREDDTARLLCG